MKAVVAAFNQEKALVGAFSVITNLRMELFQALEAAHFTHFTPTFQQLVAVMIISNFINIPSGNGHLTTGDTGEIVLQHCHWQVRTTAENVVSINKVLEGSRSVA